MGKILAGFFRDSSGKPASVPWIAFRAALAVAWAASILLLLDRGFGYRPFMTIIVLALLAAFAVTVFLRKNASFWLACWIGVAGGLAVGPFGPLFPVVWLPIAAGIHAGRRHFIAAAPPRGSWMEAVLALQMCLFVLFFAENAARWVHPVDPYFARNARNPVTVYEKAPYTPGRPTFITLGSSPATTELSANRPFTRVLSERLAGVANFRIARLGGVDSAIILKLADDAWAGGTPVDGILLYAGFQDLNQSGIQKAFRHADVLGTSNAAMASVAWLARNSVLFNIVVERAKRQALSANSSGDEPAARAVFEGFTKNIRTLLDRARAHHTKVFVMTLVPDARRLSRVGNLYVDWVNDFYLSLPREYPEITVVDFATAFAARYPDGALSDGEPFEVATDGSGRPGDPYHLGRAGHELLADTVEPGIRVWAAKWESAR